ncbi:hypothetical protein [Pseudoalteromonas maricaloris]|uniref:hypothetical protein n=1 Tax=Pseudoalteromonas maricaloris TaxID=184924 RepID=UPI00057DAF76|nr:hypothetical protein [Pseudoalteromonas flavipulchra]KID34830.1 hypothetical protein QT15_17205 [Pseudoalteromonas flavipulchra NCIMB 2033 = ATCC BAA-314]MBD0784052.1 hypothetical protein [Pseudoalteromonas flavipulchra]MBE0372879.1 hypothetical protein [Pseudoalteromonas flavipulchra NCIMB 2033 = ATCC BAA-314]
MKITSSIELLDWFKKVADIESDYMVSKLTGISKQAISRIRNGEGDFADYSALQLLVIAEHPKPLETMAYLEAEKAKKRGDEKMEKIWRSQVA